MTSVGLFEAKQKLSELVERAGKGEEITITRHRQPVARLVAARPAPAKTWKEVFDELDAYRARTRLVRNPRIREAIEDGRE